LTLFPTCRHTMVDVPILMVGSLSLRLTHPPHPDDEEDEVGGEAAGDDVVVVATGADVVFCASVTLPAAATSKTRAIERREVDLDRILFIFLFIGGGMEKPSGMNVDKLVRYEVATSRMPW
jgi:hypothetical protein